MLSIGSSLLTIVLLRLQLFWGFASFCSFEREALDALLLAICFARVANPPRPAKEPLRRLGPEVSRECLQARVSPFFQEWPRQTKPKKGQFMNFFFRRGIPEKKVRYVNRACFPEEKHQNSQKWAKSMNFSFWPFLWFAGATPDPKKGLSEGSVPRSISGRLSDPTEIVLPTPPSGDRCSNTPVDYHCYTPTSFLKDGLSQAKDRPWSMHGGGVPQKKLASEPYRAIGGIAGDRIANCAIV